MKNVQKTALKVVVLIALSGTAVLADDGDMPGGGLAANNGVPSKGAIVSTRTIDENTLDQNAGSNDTGSILNAIFQYLDSIF